MQETCAYSSSGASSSEGLASFSNASGAILPCRRARRSSSLRKRFAVTVFAASSVLVWTAPNPPLEISKRIQPNSTNSLTRSTMKALRRF